jgi:hypothetical protein
LNFSSRSIFSRDESTFGASFPLWRTIGNPADDLLKRAEENPLRDTAGIIGMSFPLFTQIATQKQNR